MEILNKKISIRDYMRLVPYFILAIAIIVIVGWQIGSILITQMNQDFVSMKFATAYSFALVGVAMLMRKTSVLFFLSGVLFSTNLYLFVSFWFSGNNASFLPALEKDAILSVAPDMPSLGTLLLFLLFSIHPFFPKYQQLIGKILYTLAALPMFGYVLDQPYLFYYIKDVSTAMALHTAVLFLHIGGWLNNEYNE